MRPVRSDYADFFYSYILSRRFFCCFFLVPQISQIYTDFSLVPNLRNPRSNRSKICVICEICVTFFFQAEQAQNLCSSVKSVGLKKL